MTCDFYFYFYFKKNVFKEITKLHYQKSYIYWQNFQSVFILSFHQQWIYRWNHRWNALLVIFGFSVSSSIIEKIFITNGFTDGKKYAKNKLSASFCRYFSREACYITDKNIICNSVSDYLKKYFLKKYI